MDDFRTIMDFRAEAATVPAGLSLVVSLISDPDHGMLGRQMDESLARSDDQKDRRVIRIVDFDPDALLDYRSRRPIVLFERDHLTEITSTALTLDLCLDDFGTQYLLLRGFEPDFNWGKLVSSIKYLIDRFAVTSVTIIHGVGIPVPHTREIGSTVSGNRPEVAKEWSVWQPVTRIPANFVHVLELALTSGSDQIPTSTFHILMPHYLGDTPNPHAAVAAIRRVNSAASLQLNTDRAEALIPEFEEKVSAAMEENDELRAMLQVLESQVDEYAANLRQQNERQVDLTNLPSGEELAAEFETFLAGQGKQTDDGPGGNPSAEG